MDHDNFIDLMPWDQWFFTYLFPTLAGYIFVWYGAYRYGLRKGEEKGAREMGQMYRAELVQVKEMVQAAKDSLSRGE